MERPLALLTNDDGLDSAFLWAVAEAAGAAFEVAVVAPTRERSWIGKAMTRLGDVRAERRPERGPAVWAVDGTPADCVNLAVFHLLGRRPAVVLSGLNIGYNTTVPLILCSGTVGAALEAAGQRIPAVAASQAVPNDLYDEVKARPAEVPPALAPTLAASARRTLAEARAWMASAPRDRTAALNLNFPAPMDDQVALVETFPAELAVGPLFREVRPGVFNFAYPDAFGGDFPEGSDRWAVERGLASRSVLDYSVLGRIRA